MTATAGTKIARRGASPTALIAAVAGAVVLVAIGFLLGRGTGTAATGDEPQANSVPIGVTDGMSPTKSAGERGPSAAIETAAVVRDADSGPPPDAPFRFEPAVLNFGIVPPDTEMRGTIRILNVSDEPMTIRAMKPDCKCTTVQDLTGTVITAGGHVDVTAVMEGRPSAGPKNSKIKFIFDTYEGTAEVQIRSDVSRMVRAEPAYFPEGQLSGEVTISSLDDRAFRILAVNGEDAPFADDFDPAVDDPRTSYALSWDLTKYDQQTCLDAEGRRMPAWWVVETDHPEAPVIDIHVRHVPCSLPEPRNGRPWVLSALSTVVGEIPAGESAEFSVVLKWVNESRKPTDTIKAVRSESSAFEADLVGLERDGDVITCRVKITPRAGHQGLLYGDVRFYGYQPGHSQPMKVIGRVG